MGDLDLDDVHIVETPEGVSLLLHPAGPPARLLAFAIDSSLRFAGYIGVLIAIALLDSQFGVSIFLLMVFAAEWFYPVCFEVLSRGQTPGKLALGIRVVREDGTPIGWSASLLRNLLLTADFMPGCYTFGLISMLTTRGFRRLGDLAAGTLVVYTEPPAAPLPAWRDVTPVAPPLALSAEEQRAVISFAERASMFSPERADELARVATPLQQAPDPPASRMLSIAAWLVGRDGGVA